jgi:hypothetical protein
MVQNKLDKILIEFEKIKKQYLKNKNHSNMP